MLRTDTDRKSVCVCVCLHLSVLYGELYNNLKTQWGKDSRIIHHISGRGGEDLPSFCLCLLWFNTPILFLLLSFSFPHLITAQEISSISPDLLTHANEAGVMEACVTHYWCNPTRPVTARSRINSACVRPSKERKSGEERERRWGLCVLQQWLNWDALGFWLEQRIWCRRAGSRERGHYRLAGW